GHLAGRFVALRRPRTSTPFPYTTLFRSEGLGPVTCGYALAGSRGPLAFEVTDDQVCGGWLRLPGSGLVSDKENPAPRIHTPPGRSEEHTSELQSRENLVCRLLLEKKNDA